MARVFIVDDSRTSRKMLTNILTENGHEVVGEAENGRVAFDTFATAKPDVITLDITMPEMDGIEALRLIKEADENVGVIMVTAAGQQNKIVEAVKCGANEFVTKPFDTQAILDAIDKCISSK